MTLPLPERERWQPLRTGLADLFHYDREEFAFRDGRLLLRGNNGTGKSKVLALTLPFLLDGDLSPHRVEPDADPKKRMEWNLLLGGEHPHPERLGYTWLEFGRTGEHGPEYCTIGCGMKAVAGRGITARWFFVTDQRVGDDGFDLVDRTGVALVADRLSEAIGTRGQLYKSRSEYRDAVDQRLFGLGEQRYGALVDLLVKIRQPQLSKRPDERTLSAALTDALPPIDQALLHNVAEAFRALEDDQAELEAMIEARDASTRYLDTYREYARMATRRRAAPLRQRNSEYEQIGRELTVAEERDRAAGTELTSAREALATLRAERARLHARQEVLRDDPSARSARDLRRAAAEAGDAEAQRRTLEATLARVSTQLSDRVGRVTRAEAEVDASLAERDEIQRRAQDHAGTAALGGAFADALTTREAAELPGVVDALIAGQRTGIARVEALGRELDRITAALAAARQVTGQRASEHADSAERRDAARDAVAEAGDGYVRAAREHLSAARELVLPDPEDVFAPLAEWVRVPDGANPFEQAVAASGREAARGLERARVQADARGAEARARIAELASEAERLEAGVHPVPPAPPTRAPGVRAGRLGAPLWQLTEFADGLEDAGRAGLEAALEASGILDGWVTATGELVDPHTEDVLVVTGGLAPDRPRLSDVLTAGDRAAGVDAAAVTAVLDRIGLGESEHAVWAAPDGRFRNGALTGAWHKSAAQFIGHAAREAARQARLAELADEIGQVRDVLAAIDAELGVLSTRRSQLDRELDERPTDEAIRDAHARLTTAEAELRGAAHRLDLAREDEASAQAGVDAAAAVLAEDARDLGLPPGGDELSAVTAAVGRLELAAVSLWGVFARVRATEESLAQARGDAADAERDRAETSAQLTEVARRHGAAVERRDTLRASAGAAIDELERQVGEVEEALRVNERAEVVAEQRLGDALTETGASGARREELEGQQTRATQERADAVDGLRRFAQTGLVAIGLPDLAAPEEWNVTQTLRLAREIEQALSADPDDDARWTRVQRRVSDELGHLADALRRHGNDASLVPEEDVTIVEIVFQGQRRTLVDLASGLAAEVGYREELLGAREREILENHLVGEVARALQELIGAAEAQVRDTNAELADRPTSTGMQLRLRWGPDPEAPDGLADARRRLLHQSSDAWSEEDRTAVGAFLRRRIGEIREDGTTTWLELLTAAFDYRHWHRFTIERRQGGSWRSATGPSSGGERVLAASVPLFAAASSYYSSAGNPYAPRLVMLDEAFAGVDDRARAKCLGLLAAFDLDVVMTSEREWGCYAEVPGLAIAQLSRIDGIAAVLVTRWEWDGAEKRRVEDPPETDPARAFPAPEGPQLWDTSTASG